MKISFDDLKSAFQKIEKESNRGEVSIKINETHHSVDITYVSSKENDVVIRLFSSDTQFFAKVIEESRLEKYK